MGVTDSLVQVQYQYIVSPRPQRGFLNRTAGEKMVGFLLCCQGLWLAKQNRYFCFFSGKWRKSAKFAR